jgi:hypothetical protein
MKTKAVTEFKAEDLVNLIRHRYTSQNGVYNKAVVLEQVPDGTGMNQNRWIDVAVFEMWPSKGLSRSAFEVKVSRSDFLRELQIPDKHKWCRECFHEFWLVAPKGVIQLEELPIGIGWMYPRGDKLCIARHALRNATPKLNDELLAGFMRAAYKGIEAATRLTAETILADSTEYKNTSLYREAVLRFLHERGIAPVYEVTVDGIYTKLAEATLDKQLKQDCNQLLSVSGTFQKTIANLATLFLVIAKRSLIARNEMGEYLVKAYDVRDEDAIEILREMGKGSKMSDYQKRYAEIIELLLNWESIASG